MTDWRQMQARIRKARASSDPPAQLAALYEHTQDAMVAFELARACEKSGATAEAIRWYAAAAERFRRAQWKQRAEEALARLGAPVAVPTVVEAAEGAGSFAPNLDSDFAEVSDKQEVSRLSPVAKLPVAEVVFQEPGAAIEQQSGIKTPDEVPGGRKRKRRGRRGGRGRNKGRQAGASSSGAGAAEAISTTSRASAPVPMAPSAEPAERRRAPEAAPLEEAPASAFQLRARSGDPGLSSRLAKLESQLRRLLACTLYSVEEPENAPAGPGVFLITDTDQTSYYYVEACQTLRVGIGNLLRSGRGSRETADVKGKLAEHLGINESRVSKYMKDNCAVRWLQLDEGAPLLAHFAIAILRPIANE